MQTGIIIVDHGSRRDESNQMLEEVARLFAVRFREKYAIIEPAHMEIAEPSIASAYARCVQRGAERVVVCPFFLGPGKHWTQDIPHLTAEAAAQFPATTLSRRADARHRRPDSRSSRQAHRLVRRSRFRLRTLHGNAPLWLAPWHGRPAHVRCISRKTNPDRADLHPSSRHATNTDTIPVSRGKSARGFVRQVNNRSLVHQYLAWLRRVIWGSMAGEGPANGEFIHAAMPTYFVPGNPVRRRLVVCRRDWENRREGDGPGRPRGGQDGECVER